MATAAALVLLIAMVALLPACAGHGAIVYPPSRNAIDHSIEPWKSFTAFKGQFCSGKYDGPCWCPATDASGKLSGASGQACWWFSNGCSIGCPSCDGVTRGPIYDPEMVKVNGAGGCAEMRPHLSHGRGYNCTRKMDTCGLGHNASICDPALRTYNREAECKGPDDWYQFSPWRAPGSAPVWDSCGMAGGHPAPATHRFGAMYFNTSLAKQGDVGSKLPRRDTGVVWRRASSVQVSWSIEANHGGGYQYRLCKADSTLDEACFQQHALQFTGSTSLRWGGPNGYRENVTNNFVTDSAPKAGLVGNLFSDITVVPKGSIWAQNPIPDPQYSADPGTFSPRCRQGKDRQCACNVYEGGCKLEIVDQVIIPEDIEPGDWVLSFRWDCEESSQVWSSCSDVKIV